MIALIDEYADSLDRTGSAERRLRKRVIVWTVAAAASLVLVAVYGLPALADRIAPLIPLPLEQRFGTVMDRQVRAMLDTGNAGDAFECGLADAEKPGRAALDRLIGRMESGREAADSLENRRGPQARSQRHCIARRTHLRLRGADQAIAHSR